MAEKMIAAVYQGVQQIDIKVVDKPQLHPGKVLIKVSYAGICGSDMGIYFGKHPRAKAPLIMGHEITGEIVETSLPEGAKIKVGDRVTVNPLISCGQCLPCQTGNAHVCRNLGLVGIDTDGGFAEFVAVDADKVVKIPEHLPLDTACLVEPLAVSVHAVRKSAYKTGDTVVILGGGPIGLLTAITARYAGASQVVICEVSQSRKALASSLGFTVVDANDKPEEEILNLTNGNGADVVFEAAGVPDTAALATQIVKITGQVVVVGVFKRPALVDLQVVNFRELSLIGTRVYTPQDYQVAVNMLVKDKSISRVISHRLPLEQVQKGFDLMLKSEDSMKILLYP
ncbi:MAG: alcohol dehydrogenase catalytic domain-containing protein [Desulfotomaculum sp.]|nr:alcohol dehydrogenase catalytic domain-containing protein [Desulfotomaculum sp.]